MPGASQQPLPGNIPVMFSHIDHFQSTEQHSAYGMLTVNSEALERHMSEFYVSISPCECSSIQYFFRMLTKRAKSFIHFIYYFITAQNRAEKRQVSVRI